MDLFGLVLILDNFNRELIMDEKNKNWIKIAEEKSFNKNYKQLHKIKRDDILVIKDGGEFYAMNNRCPHMGLPLDVGGCDIENKTVHCKFHSSDFSYDTGEVKEWLNVKGFEKFMMWLFSKFDTDAKKMMTMEPKPAEVFSTKIEDGYIWVNIE